jgi:ferredoxin-NADP reductase
MRESYGAGGAPMSTYDTTLKVRDIVAMDTMLFGFERPDGFQFKAGQAMDLVLVESEIEAARGARHTFSIVTAPSEDGLAIATRMRDSPFKQALKRLPLGAKVRLDGPFGSLVQKDAKRSAVLIAGGIGITPFMSMLRQAAHDQSPQFLMLVYCNRRPEDAPFISELTQLERANSNFRLVATMTQPGKSNIHWNGHIGRIDEALLRQVMAHVNEPLYYLAGPPAMVGDVYQTLSDIGIADDAIHSEEFYGY